MLPPETSANSRPHGEHTCPSACCETGASLLGIVGHDGIVGFITPAITIDQEFVDAARRGRPPEGRFRFAQPCVEGRCRQWTGSRCSVIDQVLMASQDAARTHDNPLPRCAIRRSCTWFAQVGREACAVCPLVIHTPLAVEQVRDVTT
jgi:hypothetical protein